MRWTLFILFCLLGAPAHAVAIPGVTTGTSTSQQAAPEPSPEQKRPMRPADVLENEASRNELIAQLREASTTPPTEPAPALAPPAAKDEKTVLENVTTVTRQYGDAFATRFAQLYRNITDAPHKPFNSQTFTNALTHFFISGRRGIWFYSVIRLCALPLYRKWACGRARKP